MRGYLNHVAAAALVFVLGAAVVAAQDTQEKSTPEKNTPEKTQEKGSPEQSGGNTTPWYSPTRYNPVKLFKHFKSANDQLASNGHLEDNLSKQLRIQGILGEDKELQGVCSDFKDLPNCIAVLRLSISVPVEFTCLKWNVTGAKPKTNSDACAGPPSGRAMPLDRALDLLKPKLDARTEAREALKKAHDDIKDASS
ncbi:MAG TPA: hypothetical protein VHM93_19310 [Candidatus Acidoferrum sp.]|jgi:hypothetical protein|nr:hypothetical protein [Candidatus Acidoferrum sp.]